MATVRDNIEIVRERVERAAIRAGRDAEEVTIVAVTKTTTVELMREAVDAGLREFGENYYQEARDKLPQFGPEVRWHFIGHLQTNKAKYIAGRFALVQSVNSIELATELGRRAFSAGISQHVLIEVKLDEAVTKFGVDPNLALEFAGQVSAIDGIELRGVMGMASFSADERVVRVQFTKLRELFDGLPADYRHTLSMGMTGDFELAIEEGSNMVRVGAAIFGPRSTR